MREAIRNFAEVSENQGDSFDKIRNEIHKITKAEIEKARKKQLRQWRKEVK